MRFFDDSPRGRIEHMWSELWQAASQRLDATRRVRKVTSVLDTPTEDVVSIPHGSPSDDPAGGNGSGGGNWHLRRPGARPMLELSVDFATPTKPSDEALDTVRDIADRFGLREDGLLLAGGGSVPGLLSTAPALGKRARGNFVKAIETYLEKREGTFGLVVASGWLPTDEERNKALARALRGGPVVATPAIDPDQALVVRTEPPSVELHVARKPRLAYRNDESDDEARLELSEILTWRSVADAAIWRIEVVD